jgi:hypothetical protein
MMVTQNCVCASRMSIARQVSTGARGPWRSETDLKVTRWPYGRPLGSYAIILLMVNDHLRRIGNPFPGLCHTSGMCTKERKCKYPSLASLILRPCPKERWAGEVRGQNSSLLLGRARPTFILIAISRHGTSHPRYWPIAASREAFVNSKVSRYPSTPSQAADSCVPTLMLGILM